MQYQFLAKTGQKRTAFSALAIIVCLSISSLGSLSSLEPAVAQSSSGGTLRVDVDLVTIEVVAQDKKGRPLVGLKREDFRLLEDGKEQQIVTFDAVTESTDQPMPVSLSDVEQQNRRGKIVLILFDDSTITSSQSKMAREAAEKYVKQHMRPWDLIGVATYGLNLKILQNLTHDGNKIVEAIRQPAASFADPARRRVLQSQQSETIPGQRERNSQQDPFGQNPLGNQEARFRAMNMLRTLSHVASSLSRVKGKKSVLLFSEDFSITAEAQTEFRNAIDTAQRSNVCFYTIDARGLDNSGFDGQRSENRLTSPRKERPASSPEKDQFSLTALSRHLPRLNMINTFSLLSMAPLTFQQQGGQQGGAGGQSGGGQTGGQTGGQAGGQSGGAGQSGGNTGTGRGGTQGTNQQDGFSNDPGSRNRNDSVGQRDPFGDQGLDRFQQAMVDNILRSLATESGGLAIFNTNNLNEGLDRVDLELSNYYVLGFQSSNPKRDGKFRKVEVKSQQKGVKLKYRKGYLDPRPLDVLAGSKGERSLMSAISAPTLPNQLPVHFRSIYFYDSPGLARVPISAKVRQGAIELKRKGGQLVNALDVMGVAYAEDGSVAARFSETLSIAVDKEQEEIFRKQDVSYRNYLKLRPGKYQLKLAVADEKGKVGAAEQTLTIPAMPSDGLAGSSLVVSQQLSSLPELIQNLQAKLLDETDPLIYKGMQVSVPVENQVNRQYPMAVFYKVYNLKSNEQDRKLSAKVKLMDEKGQSSDFAAASLDELAYPTGPGEVAIGINLPLKDLAAGKYKLAVETADTSTNQSVALETELVVQ